MPEPTDQREKQCEALNRTTGKRCEVRGFSDPEFPDQFVCEGHLNELEYWLNHFAAKDRAKHANN